MNSGPFDAGALELAASLRARTLSSVELVRGHIRRIEAWNPSLNAIVAERFEAAMDDAREADARLAVNGSAGDTPPLLVAQLRFATLVEAERALASAAVARALDEFQDMPVSNWQATIEIMRGQVHPEAGEASGDTTTVPIIYLVEYQRPADDEAAFIDYYCANHPPILAELPEIRRLEIYTPVEWSNPLALDRADTMLICDVSFDSAEALTAALHSEVRQRLRDDYNLFPPFSGRVGHYPMRRFRITP